MGAITRNLTALFLLMALDFSGDSAAVQSGPLFSTVVEQCVVEGQPPPLHTSEIPTKCPPAPSYQNRDFICLPVLYFPLLQLSSITVFFLVKLQDGLRVEMLLLTLL